MFILVDLDELKKIEAKYGVLKKVKTPAKLEKEKVKWLLPPKWNEKTYEAALVEVPDNKAQEIFEKFKVKAIRKE